jgi:alpha-L-fucosidase
MPSFVPTLESVRSHRVPEWYQDAKLGVFIHWTMASVPGFAPRSHDVQEALIGYGYGYG